MYPWTITIYILTQYHANSWKLLILYPKKKVMSALPAPSPQKKISNNKQTKNIQILYNLVVPAITLLEIFGSPSHYLSSVFQCPAYYCVNRLCLHLPQCSELTCCYLVILCYAKLFIKKKLLLTMYYKENFMWNSIIVTTVIAVNH